MENPGRPFVQIAAMAGITPGRAKIALYLTGLAREGRSLAYCALALRRKPETIKAMSRDFLIDFVDWRPFARLRDKGERVEPRVDLGPIA